MADHLHITNGDSAAELIRAGGVPGDVLPWRDVLHDGPVPGGLSLEALSDVRAGYLAHPLFGGYRRVRADFAERDRRLRAAGDCRELTLWFEHDLYDQLQLLQILDRLAERLFDGVELSMICIDRFPGVQPFYGLGQLSPGQVASLFDGRRAISAEQLNLGRLGWAAFTSDTPRALMEYLRRDISALPFLQSALIRFLQDYPGVSDGLGRSERQILALAGGGESRPAHLFRAWQALEQAPFLGDWGFWQRIAGLTNVNVPLLRCVPGPLFRLPAALRPDEAFLRQRLTLTDAGRSLVEGAANMIELNGLDRWYGGVRLRSGGPLWVWDEMPGRLHPDA